MGVERYNNRVMKVSIVIRNVVWEVMSCYCPHAGRSVNEKEGFYELMGKFMTSEEFIGMVVSILELPNKVLGRREMLLGFGIIMIKVEP